jgi:hypothetical protein
MFLRKLFLLITFGLATGGCGYVIPLPIYVPEFEVVPANWTMESDLIQSIVENQSASIKLLGIKGNKVRVYFKDSVCPCSDRREIIMKVSEVDSTRVKGYERADSYGLRKPTFMYKEPLPKAECNMTATAEEAISVARKASSRGRYFYPPSYNLIWAAETAVGPPSCNSVRAKALADEAKQVAADEGAKVLGYDLTGIYVSEITGDHPVITKLFGENRHLEPKLTIEQRGNRITGTDSSGKATLKGSRSESNLFSNVVAFKIAFPSTFKDELEGEWVVRDDGLGMEGIWRGPTGTASGKWNLWKTGQKTKSELYGKKSEEMVRKWISNQSATEIRLKDIESIFVWQNKIIEHGHWQM